MPISMVLIFVNLSSLTLTIWQFVSCVIPCSRFTWTQPCRHLSSFYYCMSFDILHVFISAVFYYCMSFDIFHGPAGSPLTLRHLHFLSGILADSFSCGQPPFCCAHSHVHQHSAHVWFRTWAHAAPYHFPTTSKLKTPDSDPAFRSVPSIHCVLIIPSLADPLMLFSVLWTVSILYPSVAQIGISCRFGFIIIIHWPCVLSCDGLFFCATSHSITSSPLWLDSLSGPNSLYCPWLPYPPSPSALCLQALASMQKCSLSANADLIPQLVLYPPQTPVCRHIVSCH